MAESPWVSISGQVYVRTGTPAKDRNQADLAVFDLDNTLIRSDTGFVYMRSAEDWVPTVNYSRLITFFRSLITEGWTIVIFNNSKEIKAGQTQITRNRIDKFIELMQLQLPEFTPYVYISIRDDQYRKPNIGMWQLFLKATGITPRASSFHCGDAFGRASWNPLYQWGDEDLEFARAIGLAHYTPEEILGTYEPPPIPNNCPLIIMAAHLCQVGTLVEDLLRTNPRYIICKLKDARHQIEKGRLPIITEERLTTQADRDRLIPFFPSDPSPLILMFTRPIRPYLPMVYARIDQSVRAYANALDYHPQMDGKVTTVPYPIIRMN